MSLAINTRQTKSVLKYQVIDNRSKTKIRDRQS